MKHTLLHRTATLPALGLLFTLFFTAHAAMAQDVTAAKPVRADAAAAMPAQVEHQIDAPPPVAYEPEPLQVGDATQNLLAWQRGGELASATPRPITGDVANSSYERYLKSFEFPIPERMISSVKSISNNGGTK
jgi:hypothetical protein